MATSNESAIQGNILRALRGNSTRLSLDNTKIASFSPAISRLTSLTTLSARNNHLGEIDDTLLLKPLQKLTTINFGGNSYSTLPICLSLLPSLTAVQLFNNHITYLEESIIITLHNLTVLNLNNNLIEEIPPSISKLKCLLVFNIANNKLSHLPREIGQLSSLTELHLQGNELEQLPLDIGRLKKLQKLYLQKNKLKSFIPSINYCKSLNTLDISCNYIQLFPKEIGDLKLKEFHYELNPLIPFVPIPSSLFEEVMTLKEIIIRKIIKLLENDTQLESVVQSIPEVKRSLSHIGRCLICDGPFVNTWLECVKFVTVKKMYPMLQITPSGSGVIPVRAILCSYDCFNKDESHEYYGIATPPNNQIMT